MTTEEFWKLYIGKKNILDIYDDTYDFFSNDLPTEFIENYDVGEVILEILGHNNTAKNFDKVIRFSELIKNKHTNLYNEYFQYIDDFLVDYYCFHKNDYEVVKAFSKFIEHPEHDYDKLLMSFKKLLFYQYIDILDETIIKIYETIKNSNKYINIPEFQLAINKLYINLENFYRNYDKNTDCDLTDFTKSLTTYDFDIPDTILTSIKNGICNDNMTTETLTENFINNRSNFIYTIETMFLKEMLNKNFHFCLIGLFWRNMKCFWEEEDKKKNKHPDQYFSVKTKNFEKFLSELSGDFFIQNYSEMIAVLWGSVYIYDFLYSIQLINQTTYNNFIETSKILKGNIIYNFINSLWNSNFVHHWIKPDSVSENEFREEEKIFQKSLQITQYKFSKVRNMIEEELNNIGELSKYIKQSSDNISNQRNQYIDENSTDDNIDDIDDDDMQYMQPIRNEPKVGRNETCPCGSGKKYKKCCLKN